MKIRSIHRKGSVLLITLLTITILTMICATSLYITSQNANATTQTTSWQQALAGAEAAADQGMNALNTGTWTGWYTITGSLPNAKPTDKTTPATVAPTVGQYNYYVPPSLTLQGEASNTMNMWVTVDPVASTFLSNNGQAYRIRATGLVGAPGPARVSNQKLDNDLRKISLRFDRKAGGTVTTPQAARTIEVIAQPNTSNPWGRALLLKNWIQMGGSGNGSAYIDSFDSSNSLKSTNGLYDPLKRQSHGDIATINSGAAGSSDLGKDYVYGNLAYSGPAVKRTQNVQGTVSTPFTTTFPTVSDPSWSSGSYSTQSLTTTKNITITASGTKQNPTLIKAAQDLNLSASATLTIAPTDNKGPYYVDIWVPGNFAISGNQAGIVQQAGVYVTFYVDQNISVAGQGVTNYNNVASTLTVIGTGSTGTASFSGQGNFIGVVEAPGYDVSITGQGSYFGAFIANTFSDFGQGGLHYDEALNKNPGGGSVAYSYASWFEDNGDKARGQTF